MTARRKPCRLANNSETQALTIAVPKGRILSELCPLLAAAGVDTQPLETPDRRLIIPTNGGAFQLMLVRASDIPTYVAHGVADIGMSGYDTLLESDVALAERLDLNIGACRLVVAAPQDSAKRGMAIPWVKIASKYPNVTRRYFRQHGIEATIIKLVGSVELAAAVGLADLVVDLVSTGETLRANNMVELETIAHITTRLVVNPASLKMRHADIDRFVNAMREALPAAQMA